MNVMREALESGPQFITYSPKTHAVMQGEHPGRGVVYTRAALQSPATPSREEIIRVINEYLSSPLYVAPPDVWETDVGHTADAIRALIREQG